VATERSWPYDFETDGTTPQQTTQGDGTKLWRMHALGHGQDGLLEVGYVGALSAAESLNNSARAGSSPAAGLTTVNAADRTINVANFMALVRGVAYELTGGDKTIQFGSNATGNPRLDRLVLKHEPAAWKTRLAIKAGTAAATPVAPALTQIDGGVWEIPIRTVLIRNGVGALSNSDLQTDDRYFLIYRPAHTLVAGPTAYGSTGDTWANMPTAQITEATFYAPPSGQVLITLGGHSDLASVAIVWLGFQIRLGGSSGTVVVSPTTTKAGLFRETLTHNDVAGPFLVSGLTPGAHHTVQLQQRTNVAGNWGATFVTAQPVP
jgi:hypothetical protein